MTSDFRLGVEVWLFCACIMKKYAVIYGQISKIALSCRKSGSRNMMMMLNFKPEVEIWQFQACVMKIMQYNAYYLMNGRNLCVALHSYCLLIVTFNCGFGYGADTTFYRTYF